MFGADLQRPHPHRQPDRGLPAAGQSSAAPTISTRDLAPGPRHPRRLALNRRFARRAMDASANFSVLNLWFTRYQTAQRRLVAEARMRRARWRRGRCSLSQQFYLGGAAFGRGYGAAEISGDNGIAGSLELRFDQKLNLRLPEAATSSTASSTAGACLERRFSSRRRRGADIGRRRRAVLPRRTICRPISAIAVPLELPRARQLSRRQPALPVHLVERIPPLPRARRDALSLESCFRPVGRTARAHKRPQISPRPLLACREDLPARADADANSYAAGTNADADARTAVVVAVIVVSAAFDVALARGIVVAVAVFLDDDAPDRPGCDSSGRLRRRPGEPAAPGPALENSLVVAMSDALALPTDSAPTPASTAIARAFIIPPPRMECALAEPKPRAAFGSATNVRKQAKIGGTRPARRIRTCSCRRSSARRRSTMRPSVIVTLIGLHAERLAGHGIEVGPARKRSSSRLAGAWRGGETRTLAGRDADGEHALEIVAQELLDVGHGLPAPPAPAPWPA